MEACGTAHFWGGDVRRGIVRSRYCRRSTSGRTSAATKRIEPTPKPCSKPRGVARCKPVPIKTVEQQTRQALHRVRTQWQAARTARINVVRGLLREQGCPVPVGARRCWPAWRDPRRRGPSRFRICSDRRSRWSSRKSARSRRHRRGRPQLARVAARASCRATATAGSGRGRANRDGDRRGRVNHIHATCELARAHAAGIDAAPAGTWAGSANAAMATSSLLPAVADT
jgi:hypothetical protein